MTADSPGGAELSSLIVLRSLAAHADEEGVVTPELLLTAVREEYRRWYGEDGDGDTPARFPADETVRYLEEHVLGRLETDGTVECSRGAGGGIGEVRLGSSLREQAGASRAGLLEQLDRCIEQALEPEPAEQTTAAALKGGSTLSGKGLVKVYRKRRVVNEVDLSLGQGEIVGLLGPNGAGKTTTFYMLVGLIAPDAGRVFFDGEDLTPVPMYRRARRGVGYLSQEPSIFRKLTVEENILAVLEMLELSQREREHRLERLLSELGIGHLREARAYSLSGGERRRLEITRALVGDPKFMLLDEPFAGVDPIAVHDIQQIVSELRHRKIGVLISDHNVEQTLDIVDRAYIMYDGRVRVSGSVSELVWNDEVAEIYLGPTLTTRMRARYPVPTDNRSQV